MSDITQFLDSLIRNIKATGEFEDAVFYRAFDGLPIPSVPEDFSVCVEIGRVTRKPKFLSIYRRNRTQITAELEFKVSAATDTQGLTVFCGRLEGAIAREVTAIKTEIGAVAYDEDMNAVYRIVKVQCVIRNA